MPAKGLHHPKAAHHCEKTCTEPQDPVCDTPPVDVTPLRRPARVAHCVVGVAHHRYGGLNWPIIDERMYGPMARWISKLAALNVQSDVFLHLVRDNKPERRPTEP
jgi:hypothetical protein